MAKTPVEVEIKLSFGNAAAARRALRSIGFELHTARALEVNTMYDSPEGTLRAQGLVVRHRKWRGNHIITFKGPAELASGKRADSIVKQRAELETTVADAAPILATWTAAGLAPSFRYEKYRSVFVRKGERGHAMLDETPIGTYVELEGAASWIDRIAGLLCYRPTQYIQQSYAALHAAACRERGVPFHDLVFPPRTK